METDGMARRSKYEYLRVMWQRYQRAGRRQRSALLDEVARVCGYHRKYAIGLLGRAVPPQPSIRQVARRRPTYSEDVIRLLAQVWEASGYLCAQRLTAALPHWLPWLKRRAAVTPALGPSSCGSVPGKSIGGSGSGSGGSSDASTAPRARAPC